MTLHQKPANATHWSLSSMAAAAGLSRSSVQRIWSKHGLKPHLIETFKVSRDRNFAAKVKDVVGLYLNPPAKALVLCVDEKSQIQALDRTQPGLPLKKGRAGTMTHDYKRNGTTTLFAALNMLDGSVIGQCLPRHRHREFLRFLKLIDAQTPADLDLHLIVDNYATHKTEAVKGWLKRHKRFHLHFTPTSASWLNMVERFFAEITRDRIRRGVFTSVAELEAAIMEYLENHNADPKPFVWTKSADEILKKVARAGKSTLLHLLAGLDEPDGGHVDIAGHRLSRRPEKVRARLRARHIGMVLQSGNLIDHLTIAENIRLQRTLAGKRDGVATKELASRLGAGGALERASRRAFRRRGGAGGPCGRLVGGTADPALRRADGGGRCGYRATDHCRSRRAAERRRRHPDCHAQSDPRRGCRPRPAAQGRKARR